MNREEIKKIIPHREPMLLVDSVEKNGETAVGKYTVKGSEFFLQGHFPGNPVVPGVILCEMMAQTCCLLADVRDATPMFTSLNNVKFKNPVRPGDTIEFKCAMTRKSGPFWFASGSGYVGDKLCISGDLSFAIIPNPTRSNV